MPFRIMVVMWRIESESLKGVSSDVLGRGGDM